MWFKMNKGGKFIRIFTANPTFEPPTFNPNPWIDQRSIGDSIVVMQSNTPTILMLSTYMNLQGNTNNVTIVGNLSVIATYMRLKDYLN